MPAAFELQFAETPFPLDPEDDLFEPAHFGGVHRHDLNLPLVVFAVMLVHLEQVAGEKRRLVAAGAGAYFDDAAGPVRVGAADRHVEELVPELFALAFEVGKLGFGKLFHFGIGPGDHLFGLFDLAVQMKEPAVLPAEFRQRPVLARHRRHPVGVGQDLGGDHLFFEHLESGELFVQKLTHRRPQKKRLFRKEPGPA